MRTFWYELMFILCKNYFYYEKCVFCSSWDISAERYELL